MYSRLFFALLSLLCLLSSCRTRRLVRQQIDYTDTGSISYYVLSDTSMVAYRNENEDEIGYFLKRDSIFIKKGKVLIFPYCSCKLIGAKAKILYFPGEMHIKGKTNLRDFESVEGSLTLQRNERVTHFSFMVYDTVKLGNQDISLINDAKNGTFWGFSFYGPGGSDKEKIKIEDSLVLQSHIKPSKEQELCKESYLEQYNREALIRRYFRKKWIKL